MKNFLKSFGLQLGVFLTVIATLGVVYAAWNTPVSSGDPLTSANWNTLVGKVSDMDTVLSFSGGNVGIGGNTPNAALHISSSNKQAGILQENTDGTSGGMYPSITQYAYNAGHAALIGGRSAGTKANPLPAPAGVTLVTMVGRAHNGIDFQEVGRISVKSGDNFSSSVLDGKIEFQVRNNNTANTAMVIKANGNVGINTTTPAQKLDVNGNIAVAGVTVHTSDKRLKKNIENITGSLDKILEMRGVKYEWKDQSDESMRGKRVGVIAQEIESILPEAVVTNTDAMQTKAVDYNAIIPVLIEAVKELKQENIRLGNRIQALGN